MLTAAEFDAECLAAWNRSLAWIASASEEELDAYDRKHFPYLYAPHLCQSDAMAEDHSERMQPYEGDAGDETDSAS